MKTTKDILKNLVVYNIFPAGFLHYTQYFMKYNINT